jgi:hypothetical protein
MTFTREKLRISAHSFSQLHNIYLHKVVVLKLFSGQEGTGYFVKWILIKLDQDRARWEQTSPARMKASTFRQVFGLLTPAFHQFFEQVVIDIPDFVSLEDAIHVSLSANSDVDFKRSINGWKEALDLLGYGESRFKRTTTVWKEAPWISVVRNYAAFRRKVFWSRHNFTDFNM